MQHPERIIPSKARNIIVGQNVSLFIVSIQSQIMVPKIPIIERHTFLLCFFNTLYHNIDEKIETKAGAAWKS